MRRCRARLSSGGEGFGAIRRFYFLGFYSLGNNTILRHRTPLPAAKNRAMFS